MMILQIRVPSQLYSNPDSTEETYFHSNFIPPSEPVPQTKIRNRKSEITFRSFVRFSVTSTKWV